MSTTTILHPRLAPVDAPARPAWHGRLAVAVLAVAGFAAAFTHVWDSDVPWHLACGEWMLRHKAIMGHDYFSIDPQAVWVNVHWLFQVIVAAIHSVAGDTGLSWLKGLVCAGGMTAFGLALRRHVPAGWLIFAGMLMLYVFQSRLRIRPELFTLALLIVTIVLADSVRRGANPNRLWFMAPIMLFWVNMHGLFFLGLAILWGFIIGGAFDAAWGRWTTRLRQRYGKGDAKRDTDASRSTGILPVSRMGVSPMQTLTTGETLVPESDQHGQDARETHGRDARATEDAGGTPARHAGKMPASRRKPWWVRFIVWREPAIHGHIASLTALAAALAATGVCLLTPWPDKTALHPLLLSTRLAEGPYSRIVTELKPLLEIVKDQPQRDAAGNVVSTMPKAVFAKEEDTYLRMLGYRVYDLCLRFHTEAMLLLAAAGIVMILNIRRVPVAHWVILFVLAVLAFKARRNVGLLGPMAGFLLALHGGAILAAVRAWKPTLARVAGPFAILMAAAALALAAAYLTGTVARWNGHGPLAGPGRQPFAQADGAAKWLGQLQLPGDMLTENFGDGGLFIYWANHGLDQPRRLSFMDGRLEAHTLERFLDMDRIRAKLSSTVTAGQDNAQIDKTSPFAPLPPTVRFIFVSGGTVRILPTMMQCKSRFKLRYIDPCGVIFERLDWQPAPGTPPQTVLLGEANWGDFDKPLNEAGLLEGQPVITRTWYRQNVPDGEFMTGYMFAWLGTQDNDSQHNSASDDQKRCNLLAIRYLNAAWTRDISNRHLMNSLMARAYHWRSWQHYVAPSTVLPVDLHSSRALHLFADVAIGSLNGEEQNHHLEQWTLALVHAGQTDTYFNRLEQWTQQYGEMKGKMTEDAARQTKLQQLREAAQRDGIYNLPPLPRAMALASLKYRLTDEAVATLEAEIGRIERGEGVSPVSRMGVPPMQNDPRTLLSSMPTTGETPVELMGETPMLRLTLGDLYMRKGDLPNAVAAYEKVHLPPEREWELQLRAGLVEWVAGERLSADSPTGHDEAEQRRTPAAPAGFFRAVAQLEALATRVPSQPIVRYYLAIMHEDLGNTARVKELRQAPDVTAFTIRATHRSHEMILQPGK
ncbi:MAG: hypothetical protein FWE88_05100 [Phycisphaerae bacterium]|nr:hypothetical protein [Phycisphaerae bacterium]